MITDDFEWDDAKAQSNLTKHKISFRAARLVFDDALSLIEPDDTEDYGEERFVAIGHANQVMIAVVFTERGSRIRIISARKANSHEQWKYRRSEAS